MAVSDESKPGKLSRDPSVMRQNVEQLFRVWEGAPNHKKGELLLKGPALAWAESWILSNAGSSDPGLKHYIMRSISRGAAQSAAGRAVAETEQLTKESRTYWAVIAMAAFTVTTLLPPLVKDALERVSTGHGKPVASIAKPEPVQPPEPQKEVLVTTVTIGPDGPVITEEMRPGGINPSVPSMVPGTARSTTPPAPTATAAASVPLPPRIQKPKSDTELALGRTRELSRLSSAAFDRGERSVATHIAIEAVKASRARASFTSDPSIEFEAVSSLYRTIQSETSLLEQGEASGARAAIEFCGPGNRAVGMLAAGRLAVWETGLGRRIGSYAAAGEPGRYLAPDRTCTKAAFEVEDYAAQLVSLSEGKPLVRLNGHEADISALEFSADGQKVITASYDATARVWDTRTGRTTTTLRGHEDRVLGARLSHDARIAVTWSEDRTTRVWDASSGRNLWKLEGHMSAVTGASFSPDATRIVTTALDGHARIWSVATGKLEATFEAPGGSIISVDYSQDGRRLAARATDAPVVIWDTASGAMLAELKGGSNDTQKLAFSADAKWVVTMSWNGRITLWSAETGRRIAELNRDADPAVSVSFGTSSNRVDATTRSGMLLSWPVFPTSELAVEHAMASAGPCLAASQREALQLGQGVAPWCAKPGEDQTAPE